jgi:hypothetical protein
LVADILLLFYRHSIGRKKALQGIDVLEKALVKRDIKYMAKIVRNYKGVF